MGAIKAANCWHTINNTSSTSSFGTDEVDIISSR